MSVPQTKTTSAIGKCVTFSSLSLAASLILVAASGVRAQNIVIEPNRFSLELVPERLTTSAVINLQATRNGPCADLGLNGVDLDTAQRLGRVSLSSYPANFTGCPFPEQIIIPIGNFSEAGDYSIDVYLENDSFDSNVDLYRSGFVGRFEFTVAQGSFIGFPETPQPGSVQSGIGLIRGWACQAETVQVQFNDDPPINIAYGTSRTDTFPICGDSDNGYGMAFAWGNLGHGTHRMRTIINGLEVSSVEFQVRGLDSPFVRGLSGAYQLEGFPEEGESVLIEWSQADQNFIITDHTSSFDEK